ncbi:MAG: hypothetical protein ACLPVO_05270 [Desulfomonilaceae bacterium]
MIRVTFDSNVWRPIASPDKFPKEPAIATFQAIRQAIIDKKVLACLAETMFTLEALKKDNRKEFFANYQPEFATSVQEQPDGWIAMGFAVKPHPTNQPTNTPHLAAHLADAVAIGFRVLRCGARIGGLRNPDIKESYFLEDTHVSQGERLNTFGLCLTQIEKRGCGIKHAKEIGEKYAKPGQTWFDGFGEAPDSEKGPVAKAIAEWADGDAVAAHIAYKNDHFCTRDVAKAAGTDSILSPQNRAWLGATYGVQFVTPEELAATLSH